MPIIILLSCDILAPSPTKRVIFAKFVNIKDTYVVLYTFKNNKLVVKYCGIINIGDKLEEIMSFYTAISRKWTLCFYGTNETFFWN